MNEGISKFYYPCCNEKECDGILSIKINDNNFSINCLCNKNNEHKRKNIYFKTFEQFYLKKVNIPRCSKCNISLENDFKYECKRCEKIYCGFCFVFDEHIKNNNNKELLLINNKCPVHRKDLTLYCKNCHEHLCIFCVEDTEENIHFKHTKENLYKIIPSTKEINYIQNEINKYKKIYEEYFSLLDEWKIKINYKIENYKQNLKDKMSLIEKLFTNFNRYFNHYTYYKNFKYFKDYIDDDRDISNAKKLIKCNSFGTFNQILKEISETNEEKGQIEIENLRGFELESPFYGRIKKIERIDDNHFFIYSSDSVKLIIQEENDDLSVLDNTRI